MSNDAAGVVLNVPGASLSEATGVMLPGFKLSGQCEVAGTSSKAVKRSVLCCQGVKLSGQCHVVVVSNEAVSCSPDVN